MEFLKCKACGSIGMVPTDVRLLDEDEAGPIEGAQAHDRQRDADEYENAEEEGDGDERSRFYSCHVCGDNWLSIRRRDDHGVSKVTFIHQMGVEPVLRRISHLQAELVLNDRSVDHWEYYLDDDKVAEGEWMNKLEDRRRVLKAICSN